MTPTFCYFIDILLFSCSVVSDSATPWTAAHQAFLFFTIFQSLVRLTSTELMMPCNLLILCHPFLFPPSIFPSIRVFSNEWTLGNRWQSIQASVSASVLPMNIQDWFPLGLTDLISLQSKGVSRVFSNTTPKHHFFSVYISWSLSNFLLDKGLISNSFTKENTSLPPI